MTNDTTSKNETNNATPAAKSKPVLNNKHLYWLIPGFSSFILIGIVFFGLNQNKPDHTLGPVQETTNSEPAGPETTTPTRADIVPTVRFAQEPTHDSDGYFDEELGIYIDSDLRADGGYRKTTVALNGVHFHVDIAESDQTRTLGLGSRERFSDEMGMLFVFGFPAQHGIWMKDMKFPIDILWLDEQYKIVHTEYNVSPDTYPTVFTPEDVAHYILEVPAGVWPNQPKHPFDFEK